MALEQDTGQDRPDPSLRANLPPPLPPSAIPSIVSSLTPDVPDIPGGAYGDVPQPDDNQNLATQFGVPTLTSQQYQGLLEGDKEITVARIGSEGALIREQERRDALYESRMQQSFDAQMAEGRHLQPWNAQAEMASRKHDLWEEFGSPGFLIAMMASAFTANPMVSALNGGAAAMNAINQGDIDAYDKAFDAWKTNTDLVLKRMEIQQRAFSDLSTLRTENMTEWREKMQHTLAMYDDQRKLNMLNYGLDEEVIKAQEAEARLQTQLASASKAIQENNIRNMLVYSNPDWPFDASGKMKPGAKFDAQRMAQIVRNAEESMSPGPKSAEQLALSTLINTPGFYDQDPADQRKQIMDVVSGVSGARYGAKGPIANVEVRRRWDQVDADHPDWTEEQKNAEKDRIYREFLSNQSWSKLSTQERNMRQAEEDWDREHPDATPDEREAAHRKIFQDWSDAKQHAKLSSDRLKQMWNPQWLDSPEGKAWRAQQSPETQEQYNKFIQQYSKGNIKVDPSTQGWTPDAIDAAAETFNETGILPHYLGARTIGPQIMGAVQARALELMKQRYPELKDDNQKLIAQRTKNWQLYHTQQVALNRYESGTQGQTITSMNVVVQHLQVLKDLSDAQNRQDWTTFNRIASWWGEEFGQEAPTDANVAAIIVGNEVIKAIQRGQLGTGEERDEAAKFFARFRSQQQIDGAIGIATKLLVGQLRAMKYGFVVATGQPESEFSRMLLPETRAYFSKAELDAMKPATDASGYNGVPSRSGGGKAPVIELDPLR